MTETTGERPAGAAVQRNVPRNDDLGRMARGLAHEFNNLLTVMVGYTDLALGGVPADSEVADHLRNVRTAIRRATDLTGRLLAYARHQPSAPSDGDLREIVARLEPALRAEAGAGTSLSLESSPDVCPVRVDADQLGRVLVEIVRNACEAIDGRPAGARIAVSIEPVRIERPADAIGGAVVPGEWVRLRVADDGPGMDDATLRCAAMPFFTTKGLSRHAGLGLATCFGIVEQHGGHLLLESTLGCGTSVTLLFPRRHAEPDHGSSPPPPDERAAVVLVVEDEPLVREVTVRALREFGFTVLEAADGLEALDVAATATGPIDLLLTDLVMPNLDGGALAERFAADRPATKVLFMSGYAEDAMVRRGAIRPGVNFLSKPFSATALVAKVREVLER